jgi:hypothetical protein
MVYNARARHAQTLLSGVLPAFLETSRSYLGLSLAAHKQPAITFGSEFVDPIRYRFSGEVAQCEELA